MALTEVFIRDITWEINTGTVAVPIWTNIGGIVDSGFPKPEVGTTDTTKNSNAGVKSHKPSSIEYKVALKGFYLEDETAGTRDAGQAACETLTAVIGSSGIKQFRFTSPGGTAKVGLASCQAGPGEGGDEDMVPWECEVRFTEKPA